MKVLEDQTYKDVSVHLDCTSLQARTPEVYLLLVKLLLRCVIAGQCGLWAALSCPLLVKAIFTQLCY